MFPAGFNDFGTIGVQVDHGLRALNVFTHVHHIDRRLHVPVVGVPIMTASISLRARISL